MDEQVKVYVTWDIRRFFCSLKTSTSKENTIRMQEDFLSDAPKRANHKDTFQGLQ